MKAKIAWVFVASFILVAALIIADTSSNARIDKQLNPLIEQMHAEIGNDPRLALSSNPYDYIKDNEAYRKIVALGEPAAISLERRLTQKRDSGLYGVIYTIAIHEIRRSGEQ
ncbi:hypothetical protein [Paenibacillus sp. NFR01]|uniref:hypothetical protein n=1 Tax=Paenibacillus sp. NFR01 TaxID=1566279 RepID=UPI0008D6AA4A|nr:hypothetical protein [Paenibacillus sp. NFR01]SET95970.1 hypothetical protein SAMN03159358_2871 [Paenibacillus sp. NFR01]